MIFLERDKAAIGVLKQNLVTLGVGRGAYEIQAGGAAKHLADWPADIVFIDPPYDKEKEYLDSLENAQGGIVIALEACMQNGGYSCHLLTNRRNRRRKLLLISPL